MFLRYQKFYFLVGPPVFKNGQQSSVITAKWKTDVSLVCKFTGVPTPIVTWLNSNEKPLKVQDSNKYNVTHRGKLVISHLRREDSQIYICKVTNELGSIKRRVTLKVQGNYTWLFQVTDYISESTVFAHHLTTTLVTIRGTSNVLITYQLIFFFHPISTSTRYAFFCAQLQNCFYQQL